METTAKSDRVSKPKVKNCYNFKAKTKIQCYPVLKQNENTVLPCFPSHAFPLLHCLDPVGLVFRLKKNI